MSHYRPTRSGPCWLSENPPDTPDEDHVEPCYLCEKSDGYAPGQWFCGKWICQACAKRLESQMTPTKEVQ